jgi:hypothetical protein
MYFHSEKKCHFSEYPVNRYLLDSPLAAVIMVANSRSQRFDKFRSLSYHLAETPANTITYNSKRPNKDSIPEVDDRMALFTASDSPWLSVVVCRPYM